MLAETIWKIATGAAGALVFAGYCLYFDRRRRSDLLFEQKLCEKSNAKENQSMEKDAKPLLNKPVMNDPESFQRFFLQEIQLGEKLILSGKFNDGIEHFANAIAAYPEPHQLLQILQGQLPPQIIQAIISQLPKAIKRLVDEKVLA